MTDEKANYTYDEWCGCQNPIEYASLSWLYDHETMSFIDSARKYVHDIRRDFSELEILPVTDEEAEHAVEAIVQVCRRVVNEDPKTNNDIIEWITE